MLNIAVLDDYQNVAFECANWSELAGKASISIFNDHIHDPDPLVANPVVDPCLFPYEANCGPCRVLCD